MFTSTQAWLTAGLLSVLTANSAAADPKPKLVVFNLVAERDIDEGVVRLLNELLLTEFAKVERFEVMGGSDIQSLLSRDQQAQLLGCADQACLTEVGGALGADQLAVSNIGRIGDYYLLNVKIIDVHNAKVLERWSTQVEGVENRLMAAVRNSVASVTKSGEATGDTPPTVADDTVTVASDDAPPVTVASPDTDGETPEGGTKKMNIWPWVAGGVAVAAVGLGTAFGVMARSSAKTAENVDEVGSQEAIPVTRRNATIANVSFGVAGAATVAAVVLWLLQPEDGSTVAAAPYVTESATGFALSASF